ncbi:MAG: polysaccharide deacetylase family protein [Rhodospirillaceae bacterium]|nr:polysaccharide deacetylase family protein [Rhodospirillaceae bacterium]
MAKTDSIYPAPIPASADPMLLVVVDAEEEFDWSVLSRDFRSVKNIDYQILAQRIWNEYGVVPTYLVDYPVVDDDRASQTLMAFMEQGLCDIGAQLHAWVTPPFDEQVNLANSYSGNLPVDCERAKIVSLTERIAQRFARRPTVFRAGRYGFGPRTADLLIEAGYKIDTSVVPATSFTEQGGPDFTDAPQALHWLGDSRALLEIPLSVGVVGALAGVPRSLLRYAFSSWSRRMHLSGLLARSGLLERIRLTPEGISLNEAKRVTRALLSRGVRLFCLNYHSSSLMPGANPYVRTEHDQQQFLKWLREYCEFFIREIGGKPTTPGAVLGLVSQSSPARIGSDPAPTT